MAVISTVAKFLPMGGSSLTGLADLYRFRASWNSMVSTIALFEGTVYNIMQPNGLYTQVLVSAKLASLNEVSSHIYSTGHFFRIVESMLTLVTNWKTHMGTLKKSKQWRAIQDLVEGMGDGNDQLEGTFGEKEMQHIQNSVNGVFNDDIELVNQLRFYVHLQVLKARYFKVCPSSGKVIKKTCLEKSDPVLGGKSVVEFLRQEVSKNEKLKEKYISGFMHHLNTDKYIEEQVLQPFLKTLAETHHGESLSVETGIRFKKGAAGKGNMHMLRAYIEPKIKQLKKSIKKTRGLIKKSSKGEQFPGGGALSKAKQFLSKSKALPSSMRSGFHRLYLMTMLEQFAGPCTATFEEYSMTMSTLMLEVNYEMWQGLTEMSGKSGYQDWIHKTRALVDNMRTCMTEPVEDEDLVKRAEKEGFGCVMMDAIHDSLQNMGYSAGFTDILNRHVKTITQHRIKSGHQEGAFHNHECAGTRHIRCGDGRCVSRSSECQSLTSTRVSGEASSEVSSEASSSRTSSSQASSSKGSSRTSSSQASSSKGSSRTSSKGSSKTSSSKASSKSSSSKASSSKSSSSKASSSKSSSSKASSKSSSDKVSSGKSSSKDSSSKGSSSEASSSKASSSKGSSKGSSSEASSDKSSSSKASSSSKGSSSDKVSSSKSSSSSRGGSTGTSTSTGASVENILKMSDVDTLSDATDQMGGAGEITTTDFTNALETEATSETTSETEETSSLSDETKTVTEYTSGLSLGGTSSLNLSFDSTLMGGSYFDSVDWGHQHYLFDD